MKKIKIKINKNKKLSHIMLGYMNFLAQKLPAQNQNFSVQ